MIFIRCLDKRHQGKGSLAKALSLFSVKLFAALREKFSRQDAKTPSKNLCGFAALRGEKYGFARFNSLAKTPRRQVKLFAALRLCEGKNAALREKISADTL